MTTRSRHWFKPHSYTHNSRPSILSMTETGGRVGRWSTSCSGVGALHRTSYRRSAWSLPGAKDRYIAGLTRFRGDRVSDWLEYFATATDRAARLAARYITAVSALQDTWRDKLRVGGHGPRADAAEWAIIDVLPAHPVISVSVATAATRRGRSRVFEAVEQLAAAGVLVPVSMASEIDGGKLSVCWT